jgi:two-component system phosphate regulon response regulator PhoB
LIARIHALLRDPRADRAQDSVRVGGLVLEPGNHCVAAGEKRLHVPRIEYRLLEFFMRNPDEVHDRPKLARIAWETDADFEERTIDVHIGRLRKALGSGGLQHLLETVRGVGYRMTARPS